MKIVIIGTVSSSIFGFRKQFLEALVTKGYDVHFFSTDATDQIASKAFNDLGIHVYSYSMSRTGLNPISDLIQTVKLSRQIRNINPDAVFSYFVKPVIFGTVAAAIAGVKRRYGMLEGLGYYFVKEADNGVKKKLIKAFQVILLNISSRLLNKLIVLNEDDKHDLNGLCIARGKTSVLGGIGVDLDEYAYSSPPDEIISFLFVGRLLAEKGINEYLEAAKIIKSRYPHVEFCVLGDIDQGNPGRVDSIRLEKLVDSGIVRYPGQVSNVKHWMQLSSVFVLPSYYREGVPRTTQEAMAVGRAIITTDRPGCKETVSDSVNGFKIEPLSAEALADTMEIFILKPSLIKEMGKASRIMAEEKYNVHQVNKHLINLLDL